MSTEIVESFRMFDLNANLTEVERLMTGELVSQAVTPIGTATVPIKDIEEDHLAKTSDDPSADLSEYNQEYVRWTKFQALIALHKFEDGWSAFEDLVLKP